jgi:hypothetical protein
METTMLRSRQVWIAILAIAAVCAPNPHARATQTDPVLEIARATAVAAAGGTLVQLDATFPADDMLQQPVPVQVLVRDLATGGTDYVRVALGGVAVSGDEPALGDGLDPEDVAGLLASGTPLAGARVLFVAPGRVEFVLPPGVPLADAEVQIFLVYEGDPLLSNPAALALDGVTP